MRIIVLFDLPTSTKEERSAATHFRNFLLDDGFDMLQYSVYSRLCSNRDIADKHIRRAKRNAPNKGSVRVMNLTEKQFTTMHILVGERSIQEMRLSARQLTFF